MRTIASILRISIYFIYLSVSIQSPPLVKSLSTAFSISVPSLKVYWCLLEQCDLDNFVSLYLKSTTQL